MKLWYCNVILANTRNRSLAVTARQLHLSSKNKKSVSDEDYQVLHRSYVNTMYFQKSLLRLGIPELDKTCSRYLRSQKAILSPGEYEETEKVVADFGNGIGKELQMKLKAQDQANKHTSYISGPWSDMYLSARDPVVLNFNPFLTFLPEERKGYDDPVIRATNILVSSMRFMNTLKKGILEPEVYHLNPAKSDTATFRKLVRWTPSPLASYTAYAFKAFPLDMSQFKNLFNSTRIPHQGKDRIAEYPDAKHMLIMKNGNFYVFDLYDQDGNILPPSHIQACVSYIYKDESPAPAFPVSVLTGDNRDIWANARNQLLSAGNEETLHLIDSAAFNIVFDETHVGKDPEKCYRTFLYGNAANRWFDKSFSLIFAADGMAALNFEHAWGDGVAVMRYFNEVAKEVIEAPKLNPDSKAANVDASQFVRKLEFKVPPGVQELIKESMASYEKRTSALAVDIYESDVFGKKFCKENKVSPDAMMQLGFQVAYYLQNGCTVASYESCSTSAFKHGRTETLRPATLETTAFSKSVALPESQRPSSDELKKSLHECSKMHGQLTKEAAMGQGFDRHLFGLRKIAEADGKGLPAFYTDPSYAKINHNIISTSTLPSSYISFGGFAPVVLDGFGVGYQIQDDRLGLVLSSYPPHRQGKEFIECADKAYKTIYDVLTKS